MNIREVAKRAGVSTATVSRVVNGTAPVDARTEKRVRAAAEGDFTVCFYNPRSRKRDWQLPKADALLFRIVCDTI